MRPSQRNDVFNDSGERGNITPMLVVLRRGVAFLLDFMFLSLFFFPATYFYSGKWIMSPEEHLWGISDPICLVFLFVIFAYFILTEAYVGWTVGKKIIGMKIVDSGGSKIGLYKSIVRNLLRLVDGLPAFNILGIILIATSPKGQRFGDRVAKTYVTNIRRVNDGFCGRGTGEAQE